MKNMFKPIAILAMLGFPIALIGFRLGLFGFSLSSKVIALSGLLAAAVFFLGLFVSFIKRRSDPELSKVARTASYLALVPIIGLGTQVFQAKSVPFIHNISTDVNNPPAFVKVVEIRSAEHNSLVYDSDQIASLQLAAYPDVKTFLTELSSTEAHAKALKIVESRRWDIVNSDPEAGLIEATDTSFIWGFKDDVVIRVVDQGDQRALDLRSVSRIGQSDLGANAKRIESFLEAFASN